MWAQKSAVIEEVIRNPRLFLQNLSNRTTFLELTAMNLIELKLIFSVIAFTGGAIGVLTAWVPREGARGERFMAWGDTFAGGVLAGAALIHLLSAGADSFRALDPSSKFPLAFVLAGAGFLLILLIEGVIIADPDPSQSPLHSGSRGASHEVSPQIHSSEPHPFVFVLLLVLSIHSMIVGLTLGAQSSVTSTVIVLIAIMAHKSVAGFAPGISYRRAGHSLRGALPVAAFFSSMTPLGILAGTAIGALIPPVGQHIFEAVFDSVGAGTFLYIATLDIIRTEFELSGDRWQKWLLASLGFGVMGLLAVWA
jgi:solute carrier family 39 (zinc transporter), member 1/2/3